MHRILVIWLVILIMGASTSSGEEAAYVFGKAGAVKLEQGSLSELNGSEVATFSVTSGSGGTSGGAICPGDKNLTVIKREIEKRVDVGNSIVADEAAFYTGNVSGAHTVEQICEIFDYISTHWSYKDDPRCVELYRYANQTIQNGKRTGLAGQGDCDDFAILMSSLIENIGGTTRINLVYNESQGHAYAEVFIGQIDFPDNRVNKTVSWLETKYDTDTIYAHIDNDTGNVWLNLDWWAAHPGGPFYSIDNHAELVGIMPGNMVPLTPPNIPPVAILSYAPEEPNARETITFDASLSLDPYGKIVDYKWNFGDGEKANDPVVDHTYQKGGTKTVSLTVTDDEGETNSNTSVIEVNEPPVAQFGYSINKTELGYIINLDASESRDEEDGDVAYYRWSFGDKQSTEEDPDLIRTYHIYPNSGTFNVSLTVKDSKKAEGFKSIPIEINEPPIAKFAIDKSEVNIDDEISFDASDSNDSDGKITEYRWNFGDGKTAEGDSDSVSHNYSTYGNFTVKLVVKDDDNVTASTESAIHVNKPPVVSFTFTPAEPAVDDKIIFISNIEDEDGINTIEWDFGDGNSKSKLPTVYHNYPAVDTFPVTLTVTDNKGGISSSSLEVTVREKTPPVIQEFRADPEVIKCGDGADLIWSVSDAASVVIEPDIGSVPLSSGTRTVFPNDSTVYTLKASNPDGTSNETVRITLEFEMWNRTFGGAEGDAGHSVSETSDGGYIVAGGTDSFGAGNNGLWLIKTDSSGNKLWDRIFARTDSHTVRSGFETKDGGYIIVGRTGGWGVADAWLIKTDSEGYKIWDKTLDVNDTHDEPYSAQQTRDGGYIITGGTFFESNQDVMLIKTDSLGNKMWNKTFGGTGVDKGDSVLETRDGGYIIAGVTGSYGAGWSDAWLIKTDSFGKKLWDRTFGGSGHDWFNSIQETIDGGHIITGTTGSYSDNADVWLIKTDSYGNKMWEKTFGSGGSGNQGYSVQQTKDGGYIITGVCHTYDSYGSVEEDVWLIKTDPFGNKMWDKTFGGTESDVGRSVQETRDGGYIIAGYTHSYGAGEGDVWLIKTDPSGNSIS